MEQAATLPFRLPRPGAMPAPGPARRRLPARFLCAALLLTALLLPALMLPGMGRAAPGQGGVAATAAICDLAARQASQESGVPLDVMRAITRTETGRKLDGVFRPWPWTINMEGKGLWFDSPEEAVAYARASHAEGARSFDMGCFQVNFRWHGEHFDSLEAMMDPLTNARYAARFLAELHEESGDWQRAAGHYHSRTPEFSARYGARFARLRAGLPPMPEGEGFGPLPARAPVSLAMVALPRTAGAVAMVLPASTGGLLARASPDGLLTSARPLFD